MLQLHAFKPNLGIRSPSPPSLKADALLAMSGLAYERKYTSLRKAPRGKFPVLVDGDMVVPDSAHIQAYLETYKDIDFDATLSPSQLAQAQAFRRLVEDHLYFINSHFRWIEDSETTKNALFKDVPKPIRGVVFNAVRKKVRKTSYLQGLGRHTRHELIAFGKQDINAIATHLDTNPFFMGTEPTSIDACVYAMLENILNSQADVPFKNHALSHGNLVEYCNRFRSTVFGEN